LLDRLAKTSFDVQMVDILVHPTELRQISDQLKSGAQKIGTALQAIDNDILSLKGDGFMGNCANAVQMHYAPKRDALLKAKNIVGHFSEDLILAASRFESADSNQISAYTMERRDLLGQEMQKRYEQLKNAGLVPATTDKFDSETAIGIVLLNPENRKVIEETAKKYGLDPALLAGAVTAEMDLDYDWKDGIQDGLGRIGIGLGDGPGVANVHNASLEFAIQYLKSHDLPGKDFAQTYDWSASNRSSFTGSVEGAAIVLAMYADAHGGVSTSDDMAVVWGAYKNGIKDFVLNDPGEGYASVEDFQNNIANGASGDFIMGTNAYYAQPYFEYFREAFSQPTPDVQYQNYPVPQIVPTPNPPITPSP